MAATSFASSWSLLASSLRTWFSFSASAATCFLPIASSSCLAHGVRCVSSSMALGWRSGSQSRIVGEHDLAHARVVEPAQRGQHAASQSRRRRAIIGQQRLHRVQQRRVFRGNRARPAPRSRRSSEWLAGQQHLAYALQRRRHPATSWPGTRRPDTADRSRCAAEHRSQKRLQLVPQRYQLCAGDLAGSAPWRPSSPGTVEPLPVWLPSPFDQHLEQHRPPAPGRSLLRPDKPVDQARP